MIRFIIFVFLIYLIYKIIHQSKRMTSGKKETPSTTSEDLVEDPCCHKYVPMSQAYMKEIDGKKIYFCSRECSDQYQSK